ncbi:hypothetical protein D3C73_1000130 [compost metagenome]
MADVPFIYFGAGIACAVLRLLDFMRPVARPFGGFRQPPDIRLQLIVLRQLVGILPLLVLPPFREIPLMNLNARLIDRQNMVDAIVQKSPVMRYQDVAVFAPQIIADQLARFHVQMVGRLINQ